MSMTVKQFGFVPHVSVKSSTGRGRSSSPSISTVSSKLAIRRFGDSEGEKRAEFPRCFRTLVVKIEKHTFNLRFGSV